MPQDPNLTGRVLQWKDLQGPQRKIVSDNIRQAGVDLPKTAHAEAEKLRATEARGGASAAKARVQANSLEQVAPHLKSQPVTLQRAANARQGYYNEAIEDRAKSNPHDPQQVIPTGAGWYFEHHKAIAASASQHGYETDRAIAASGVMSPQNSPENERASVHAIMDANANHSVTITPEVHEHLAKSGIDVSEHVGKRVPFKNLPTGTVAQLSDRKIRGHLDTKADMEQVARGGTRTNITKAERVLSGEIPHDAAMDPHSAPKVSSYIRNTQMAVPGSPTHVEYMGRVHQDAAVRRGLIDKHQQALDLYGHGEKTGEHLLSPESHTVEDTWQNAATFDQPKTTVNRASVFKAAGSMAATYPVGGIKTRVDPSTGKRQSAHSDPRVGATALTHAFNNRATQKAAEQQSRGSGVTVPPVAVQEVGWVQMRRNAGKAPEYAEQDRPKPSPAPDRGQPMLPIFQDRRK